MSYDNRNRPSNSKDMNSLTSTRSHPFNYSRQKSSAKMPAKPLLSKRGKWTTNIATKYQREQNVPLQNETLRVKRVKSNVESIENKSYHDVHNEDPVTILRKEIQEWRINELLTYRTEERFTGTPSEQHSCSYVTSGETTKRLSPNNVPKTPPISADFPAVTKKHNGLEYLDLSTDPSVRLIASCRSRMHSRSQCDCYCKTRVPIAQQREEIHSERSRIRSCRSPRTETVRSAKKIPLIPVRIVDDEQLDSKISSASLSASPLLSPETSAVLEDVEKLIKNAQIQMKEIDMTTNDGRLKKCLPVYSEETPLNDENDQILYIRERVAYKFQVANGWIDSYANVEGKFTNEDRVGVKSKRFVDLSAPKFTTSEDRYKEFSRGKQFETEKLGLPRSLINNEDGDKRENDGQVCTSEQKREEYRKIDTFSVRMCPAVNIKGELITQNLENIHISPDPSFVQESQNVRTYVVSHEFSEKNESPRRKQKFIKILEDNNDSASVNDKIKSGNSKDYDDNRGDSDSADLLQKQTNVSKENKEKLIENIDKMHEINKPMKNMENEKDVSYDGEKFEDNAGNRTRDVATIKAEMEAGQEETEVSTIKIISKNEQKQVRFEEKTVEIHIESRTKEEGKADSEQDLRAFARSTESKSQKITKTNAELFKLPSFITEVKTDDESSKIPLLSKEMEEKRTINKKGQREMIKKQEVEKDRNYKIMIDQRFADIVKTYGGKNDKSSENVSYTASSSINSSEPENSEQFDDIYNLYQPPINELDNVLFAYDKVIGNIVRSTKVIDEFLSRPEIEEYRRLQDEGKMKTQHSIPVNKRKAETIKKDNSHKSQVKQKIESRIKRPVIKNRLTRLANKNMNTECESRKMKQIKSTAPIFVKNDNDSKRKTFFKDISSKAIDTDVAGPSFKMRDRLNTWKMISNEETTKASENNDDQNRKREINEIGKMHCSKTHFLQMKHDISSSISSTNPLSSSSDTKTIDETGMIHEILESQINQQNEEKITDMKLNIREDDEKDIKNDNFHYTRSQSDTVVKSDDLNKIFSEEKAMDHLITRILQEETRFIEEKVKHIFNVDEIAPVMAKSLIEDLKNNAPSFGNLVLLISENAPTINTASINIQTGIGSIKKTETGRQNLQLRCLPEEDNVSITEAVKCSDNAIEENILAKSNYEINITNPISDDENQTKNENSKRIRPDKTRNSDVIKNEIDGAKRGLKKDEENIISMKIESGEHQIDENLQKNRTVQDINNKTSSMQNKKSELKRIDNIEENVNSKRNDNSKSPDKALSLANDPSELINEEPVKSDSIENPGNNILQVSSSDSLRDCVSLRSPSKNNTEISQEVKRSSETNNSIGGAIMNTLCFVNAIDKEKVLSDVYEDMKKQFLSSTCLDANYSNVLNQQYRFSNVASTISTIESTKVGTSSDTSRSEGELYFPSSGSYSLGEVRILTSNHSDGENTDLDNETKKMLASWNESSKSLVKSMGEI